MCDGADLAGQTCASLGPDRFAAGELACEVGCGSFDTAACHSGDCCLPHGGVGCEIAPMADCVCDIDASCCGEAWDEVCAEIAVDQCEAACG